MIGRALTKVMAAAEMDAAELAELSGLQITTVIRHMGNITTPRMLDLFKIVTALGVRPEELAVDDPNLLRMIKDLKPIKYYRLVNGLSLREISERTGLEEHDLGAIESPTNRRRLTQSETLSVAEAIGVAPEYLVDIEDVRFHDRDGREASYRVYKSMNEVLGDIK